MFECLKLRLLRLAGFVSESRAPLSAEGIRDGAGVFQQGTQAEARHEGFPRRTREDARSH